MARSPPSFRTSVALALDIGSTRRQPIAFVPASKRSGSGSGPWLSTGLFFKVCGDSDIIRYSLACTTAVRPPWQPLRINFSQTLKAGGHLPPPAKSDERLWKTTASEMEPRFRRRSEKRRAGQDGGSSGKSRGEP